MSGSDGFDPLASLFDAPPVRKLRQDGPASDETALDAPIPGGFKTEFTDPRVSDVDLDADDFGEFDDEPHTDVRLKDRITQEVAREQAALDAPPPVVDESTRKAAAQAALEKAEAERVEAAQIAAEQAAADKAQALQLARRLAEEAKQKAEEEARVEQAQREAERQAEEAEKRKQEAAELARRLAEEAKRKAKKKKKAAPAAAQKAKRSSLMARGQRPTSAKEALARAVEREVVEATVEEPAGLAAAQFQSVLPGGRALNWVLAEDRQTLLGRWAKHLERGRQRSDVALVVAAQQVLAALDEVPAGHLWFGDVILKRLSWVVVLDTQQGRIVAALSPAGSYMPAG